MKIGNNDYSLSQLNALSIDERNHLRENAKEELINKYQEGKQSSLENFDPAKVEFVFGDVNQNGQSDGNLNQAEITAFFNSASEVCLSKSTLPQGSSEANISLDGIGGTEKATSSTSIRDKLINDFINDEHIYSQNFGYIDNAHIMHNFNAYRKVFAAIEKANQTGQPQEVSLKYGGGLAGAKELNVTYQVKPESDQTKMHTMARQIIADMSYRYEHSTQLFGGKANKVFEKVGMGSSAFSTEDLPSNGLGMMAAEHFIKAHGNSRFSDLDYAQALAHIFAKAGKLSRHAPGHDVKMQSFGNKTFIPKRSTSLSPENGSDQYLQNLDRDRQVNGNMPGKGDGWKITKNDGGLQGALETLSGIPRIIH